MRLNDRARGYWVCAIRKRENTRRAQARYRKTEKGRAIDERWSREPSVLLAKQLRDMARVRVRY